jgi:hypothetical protein
LHRPNQTNLRPGPSRLSRSVIVRLRRVVASPIS